MGDINNDVRGKLGDVSGFEVGGKLGDVSGNETFEEMLGAVTQDQRKEILHCLEIRVNRLEYQLFALTRWLDRRVSVNTNRLDNLDATAQDHDDRIVNLKGQVEGHEGRIRNLECPTRGNAT